MAETNPTELDKIPRVESAKLNATAFGVSEKEESKVMEMQKELSTKTKLDSSQLTGMEKMMGVMAKDISKISQKKKTEK